MVVGVKDGVGQSTDIDGGQVGLIELGEVSKKIS